MKRLLKYSLVVALTLGINMTYAKPPKDNHPDPPKPRTAPEVDVTLAAGGLALLSGTIAVLRTRRHK